MDTNIDGGVRQSPFSLYRGSDFFESFIPSTWFLLGVLIVEILFFGTAGAHRALQELVRLRNAVAITSDDVAPGTPASAAGVTASHGARQAQAAPAAPKNPPPQAPRSAAEPVQVSLTLEIFFVLLLAIVSISLVFIFGQIMNGVSAAVLDRVVVKKLLHYPFELYQLWARDTSLASHRVVRLAVLKASYLVHCVNLIPLLLLELVIVRIDIPAVRRGDLGPGWTIATALLVMLHFGAPAVWSHRKYDQLNNRLGSWLVVLHGVFIAATAATLVYQIERGRNYAWIFALAVINGCVALADRVWGAPAIKADTTAGAVFFYLRVSFPNVIYWAAKLVNYSDLAKPQITREAEQLIGQNASSDLFWASYLTVQNIAPRSFLPISHFLALYGMMRNLCNATMLVWLYTVIALGSRQTVASAPRALWWTATLGVIGFLCFARYLYLYGSYFSKYVVRAAAVLQRLNSLHLLGGEAGQVNVRPAAPSTR